MNVNNDKKRITQPEIGFVLFLLTTIFREHNCAKQKYSLENWYVFHSFVVKVFPYIYDLEFNHKEYFDALLNSYTKKNQKAIKIPLKMYFSAIKYYFLFLP